jgi:hypothetical protein
MKQSILVVLMAIEMVLALGNTGFAKYEDPLLRKGVELRAEEVMLIDSFGKNQDLITGLSKESREFKDKFDFIDNWDENYYNALKVQDSTKTCEDRQIASAYVRPAFLWYTLDADSPTIIKATDYLDLCQKAFPGKLSANEIATAPPAEIESHMLAIEKRNGVSLSRAIIQIWFQEVAPECSPAEWTDGTVKFVTEERLREIIAEKNKK